MRIDTYTKAVLTVIALLLAVIVFKPLIRPDTTATAQGSFAGVQMIGPALTFFDTRTGEIWEYQGCYYDDDTAICGQLQPLQKYRLTKLGQPLVREFQAPHKNRK